MKIAKGRLRRADWSFTSERVEEGDRAPTFSCVVKRDAGATRIYGTRRVLRFSAHVYFTRPRFN